LSRLKEVLERSVERSGPILRKLLGQIRLEPTRGDIGRPYYVAKTSLDTLALLDESPDGGPESGSNSWRWWRRRDRIIGLCTGAYSRMVLETFVDKASRHQKDSRGLVFSRLMAATMVPIWCPTASTKE